MFKWNWLSCHMIRVHMAILSWVSFLSLALEYNKVKQVVHISQASKELRGALQKKSNPKNVFKKMRNLGCFQKSS